MLGMRACARAGKALHTARDEGIGCMWGEQREAVRSHSHSRLGDWLYITCSAAHMKVICQTGGAEHDSCLITA